MRKPFLFFISLFSLTLVYAQNQERLSVHYFDIPESLEEQFMNFNKQINQELEKAGYGKNFYKIYKVKKNDKASMHRYFQISSYTSDKHYEMTHDVSENYNKILDAFWESDLAKAFNKNRIYRKVYRIEN
ncbi:MAG: hypothetical protein VW976_01625 [Flavobacteriaceae bacterium]